MAVDRLSLYNGALRECQERRLASLAENREPRRVLDDVWNSGDGLLRYVLGRKQWTFGRRTVQIDSETAITPEFGYSYAFAQPDDFVRTCRLCTDEHLKAPLLDYQVEAGYWYADTDPLYLTYISDDTDYGGDFNKWPADFVLYVETHLASLIVGRLTGSNADRNDLLKLADMRLKTAANSSAMEEPTQFPPEGSWVRARRGGSSGADRGSRSRLIG